MGSRIDGSKVHAAVTTLPKWKMNEIFRAIEAARLASEEFDWDDNADILRHRLSPAFFEFGGVPGAYTARFIAGDGMVEERQAASWAAQVRLVQRWLSDVKRDTETPDLWAELGRRTDLLQAASNDTIENSQFTPDERADIARQLNELRDYMRTAYSLTAAELQHLDSTVEYLVDATSRLSRKDWLLACLGGMFGYVFSAALPPDAARHIVQTFVGNIAHIIDHGIRGLGSG
jgi:hypothetical protein